MSALHQDLFLLQNGAPALFRPARKKKSAAPTVILVLAASVVAMGASLYAVTTIGKDEPKPMAQPSTLNPAPIKTPPPSLVTITIETNPPGAQIYLDGQAQPQRTPARLSVPGKDKAMLLLQKEGFEDSLQPISLRAAISLRLDLTAIPIKTIKKIPKDTTPPDQLDPYQKKKP